MSYVCIFNIIKDINDYEELNNIARELVQTALKSNLGISFHSEYYDVSNLSSFRNYFLLSDSFLYRHSDELLNTSDFWDNKSIDCFKEKFINKFEFFNVLINKIFSFKIDKIEIYFADTNESSETLEDFEVVKTNDSRFIIDLLNVVLENMNDFGGTIPTFFKFEVIKS